MSSRFASQTRFAALAVESSGEESEDDAVQEVPVSEESPENSTPPVPKLTKTAMKKAAKAARLEKLKQQADAMQEDTPLPVSTSDVASSPETNSIQETPVSDVANNTESMVPVTVVELTTDSSHVDNDVSVAQKVAETSNIPPPVASAPPKECSAQNLDHADTVPTNSPAAPSVVKTDSVGHNNILPPSSDAETAKKRQNVFTRTLWTFIMIFGFIGLLLMGHAYMILLVMLCQTLVYREVTALFSLRSSDSKVVEGKNGKDPWSKTLNWYFFAVTNYFLYGESIIYYFKHVVFSDAQLLPFATNHRIISFTLYTFGFMGFVMSLKRGYLKQQFGLFCWVHMSLLLIVVSSHFIVNNILEGLIWFWVPASLVICNDVFAYVWGMSIGRTPLIKLSPKKTVEGFVGAFGSTVLFSLAWGTYFMRFKYMICPVHDLGVSAWSSVDCVPNPVFVWRDWQIWSPIATVLSNTLGQPITTIPYVPYHLHLLLLSCFASLVAPFGGFFASGFKRAFNIKDFGHSIPGHGGMTDRMDCQFLMGVFTYVYYSSLIHQHHVTVGSVLQTIVSGLTVEEQLELIADLRRYLEGSGVQIPC
ncbi:phosphatidate cytidylyltransferase [Stygiomarasmius scandens]|uniref:Phosphatidate cytidylyltransferase n=1 Tax=Marasmiellus scandens TaxID=2682957 RepID=A0ABR1KAX9_9AGAR